MTATSCPPHLSWHNMDRGPPVAVAATRPGRVNDRFRAVGPGDEFALNEGEAVELEARGVVRIVGEMTRAGRDYRAAFALHGLAAGGYVSYASALFRHGPTDPDGDVGPRVRARVIDGKSLVVAGVLRRAGEFVRRTEPGRDGRDLYRPGEPFEAAEGLLAVPFYDRLVELLGDPSPRFKRFVDAYAAYRRRCELSTTPGLCPEY